MIISKNLFFSRFSSKNFNYLRNFGVNSRLSFLSNSLIKVTNFKFGEEKIKHKEDNKDKQEAKEKKECHEHLEDWVPMNKFKELEDSFKLMSKKAEEYQKKVEELEKGNKFHSEQEEGLKNRLENENIHVRDYAISEFAKELLEVCDNFDRALKSTKDKDFKSIKDEEKYDLLKGLIEGIELNYELFANSLKKQGIDQFDPTDEVFDPNRHDKVEESQDKTKVRRYIN